MLLSILTSATTPSPPNLATSPHSKNPMNWIAGSFEVRKLHHHQRPKVVTLAVVPMVGSQAGAESQPEMAILDSETVMDIKDTDIKMVVDTTLLLHHLTVVTETEYSPLHQWKNEDLLGDGTIALIRDYHLDPLRQSTFLPCRMMVADLIVLTAIALVPVRQCTERRHLYS
jgi:hypothetical protein